MTKRRPDIDAAVRAAERRRRVQEAAPEMYELLRRFEVLLKGDELTWKESNCWTQWCDAVVDVVVKIEDETEKEKPDESR